MSTPEYVPHPKQEKARVYESPPRRGDSWMPDRPADLRDGQPSGPLFGSPGPDQGYVLKLVRHFEARLRLAPGEDRDDVVTGCCAVALKRASAFGRAPTIHDLNVAFTIFGFLHDDPDPEQVKMRRPLFEEVRNHHHYRELRAIVDLVPVEVLRQTAVQVQEQAERDWRDVVTPPTPLAAGID
jgi:hypothetical protein